MSWTQHYMNTFTMTCVVWSNLVILLSGKTVTLTTLS